MSEHIGLIAAAHIWSLIAWVLKRQGVDKSKTVSKHVAEDKVTKRTFAMLLPIGIVLFGYFVAIQLTARVGMADVFKWMMLAVVPLFFVVALVPDEGGGKKSIVHRVAAYGGYYLLVIFAAALIFNTEGLSRGIAVLCAVIMAYVSTKLRPTERGTHDLYYQLGVIATFDIGVLSIYYLNA